ncbi:plastocyanin/azurin family copper-binding protein [Mycobacterium sp.]|uniref:plastocyanin/azurin family copper-binding protein n=1 Tax=Mycobacterium sp. TaxID=1785 RepID=UPI002CE3CF52|nr:plastocyanin/azurin family copper-binding protein [Mycobacterium sp.]HKP41268.1 plastocyanin/azurin family copper-binding protein [Mycobacterium sp.]
MKVLFPLAAAGILLSTACSGPASNTTPTAPSITFQPGMTPGMSGHAMPGMQSPPASASATLSDSPAPQGGTAVSISDFKFNPATLTVPVSTTVTWTNQDEEPHTIAAKDGSFHSPGMDTHGTYSFTFTTPGSYEYICSIHPFMTGTVVVTK